MSCNSLQNALSSELILHARDIVTVKQLLLNGADVNYQSDEGWCLLFEFISLDLDQHILSLEEFSLNTDVKDGKGRSALFWAIHHESAKVMNALLQLGCDVSELVMDGLPALHYAVYKSNAKIVNVLLEKGADIESHDMHKNTALSYAYLYKKEEMITLLKQRGACTANLDYNM